jgi:hypothetical protein
VLYLLSNYHKMALTANVYLEINNTTKKGRIVDASNYTAEGIILAQYQAKGLGNVYSPTGAIIVNGSTVGSPLVNLVSTTTSAWFNLPLDSNGEILNGTYSFTYSLRYAITAGTVNSVSTTSTFELEFTNAGRVLIAGDSLVVVANTETENNGTFTVATAAFDEGIDNSTIVVTQTTLVNEAVATGTYSFDVTRANFAGSTYTFNGCNLVTPSVTVTYDCESTQFGSIVFQDSTVLNGQTVVSRDLSGYYPNGLYPAPATNPQTTTLNSLTFSELAVGTWTHVLVLNMSVTQSDGLVYTYQVRDTGETLVTCVGTLCGLTPCIESLKDKFNASYVKGQDSGLNNLILLVLQLYALAKEYKTCGNNAMYAATVAQLESVLNESGQCSCGCCDENQDVPYWVDNSNLDATSIIAQLQEEIDNLNLQVLGLGNAVQENADALEAYNAIVAAIASYDADLLGILAQVTQIQSAALALDPTSSTFEDDVDQLEVWADALEVSFGFVVTDLNGIVALLDAFIADFPEYSQYTVNIATYLTQSQNAAGDIQDAIDQLQLFLASLTPSTYLDDIQDIWDVIAIILNEVTSLGNQINLINAWLTDIQTVISNLYNDLLDLTNEVNTLTATVNGLHKFRMLGFYVDENGSTNLFIPADWLNEKIFYKFSIKGTSSDAAAQIKLTNSNINTTVFGVVVGNNAYDIQLNLCYVPADGVWKIGGTVNIGGSLAVTGDFTIDPVTLLPFNTNTVLVVSTTGVALSNTFYAIDGFAYRQY